MAYVALVTGASAGIGAATARRMSREPDVALVLVARREDRLQALAREIGGATVLAVDLTDAGAPGRIREVVEREHGGALHMLVNNAGASWRGAFGEVGWANVERHMRLDFEAPVRLTEAPLPLLRRAAAEQAGSPRAAGRRVCIVNVASTAARIGRPGAGAYSAAKFALAGWTESLHAEEHAHGVHVGLVLPGFVATEGFPATELTARLRTRWLVAQPEVVAEAILEAGPRGRPECYTPRAYRLLAVLRTLAPGLIRRATRTGAFTTATRPGE
jgi:short-subunit dehydrogenase